MATYPLRDWYQALADVTLEEFSWIERARLPRYIRWRGADNSVRECLSFGHGSKYGAVAERLLARVWVPKITMAVKSAGTLWIPIEGPSMLGQLTHRPAAIRTIEAAIAGFPGEPMAAWDDRTMLARPGQWDAIVRAVKRTGAAIEPWKPR